MSPRRRLACLPFVGTSRVVALPRNPDFEDKRRVAGDQRAIEEQGPNQADFPLNGGSASP
jgi:hypothetical protein